MVALGIGVFNPSFKVFSPRASLEFDLGSLGFTLPPLSSEGKASQASPDGSQVFVTAARPRTRRPRFHHQRVRRGHRKGDRGSTYDSPGAAARMGLRSGCQSERSTVFVTGASKGAGPSTTPPSPMTPPTATWTRKERFDEGLYDSAAALA